MGIDILPGINLAVLDIGFDLAVEIFRAA